jgi:DNA-binding MarR family transcriptional regulator
MTDLTTNMTNRVKMTAPLTCHCFAIRQLARHVSKLYERHLGKAHITSTQYSILVLLQRSPRTTMRDLAGVMVMERTTLLRAIKPLQREGLVTSAHEPGSPQLAFSVTRKGAVRIEKARPLWQAAQQEYEALAGPERAARFRSDSFDLTRET